MSTPGVTNLAGAGLGASFIEQLHGCGNFQGFVVEDILFEGSSTFQSIVVFRTQKLGRVLVLDGVVQTTEADEFIYHEMLTHVPLMTAESLDRVLIVGGGDGGILREVLKHPVKTVDLVEIDEAVIRTAREYLPFLNRAGACFDDSRANVIVQDAVAYLKRCSDKYDAIIIDSTDPIGMAEALYSEDFYRCCENTLTDRGVLSAQDGVVFFQAGEIAQSIAALRRVGLLAGAYIAAVPTYFGGEMTFGLAGRNADVLKPSLELLQRHYQRLSGTTKHYSPAVHGASLVLPKWIEDAVEGRVE